MGDDIATKLGGVVVGKQQEDGSWTCECGQNFRHDVALYVHRRDEHRSGLTSPCDADPASSP